MSTKPSIRQLLGAVTLSAFSALASAVPEVTSVSFHNANDAAIPVNVAADHYVAVGTFNMAPRSYDPTSTESALYVMNGRSASTTLATDAPNYQPYMPAYTNAPTPLLGFNGLWGTALVQLYYSASNINATGLDLMNLPNQLPTNSNTEILNGATGPVNKGNLSLAEAGIAAGTDVTMMIDMKGETPHLVAVYGGSAPQVDYNATTGLLTITSTTTPDNLANAAGDVFSSAFGIMIGTDIGISLADPTQPVGLIVQTEHWVGDLFPKLPGFDSNAAIPNSGGTLGTDTARCGSTVYGPKDKTRNVNLFISDAAIPVVFGAGATSINDLKALIGAAPTGEVEVIDKTVTPTTNLGMTGAKVNFPYTFASTSSDLTLAKSTAVLHAPIPTATTSSGDSGGGGALYLLLPLLGLLWVARRRS